MIFDANVSYGPVYTPVLKPCRNPFELEEAMDWAGVDRALVTADLIRNGAPAAMNPLVAEEMKSHGRLEPVWAALPLSDGEPGGAGGFFAAMKKHGVRVLAAFPSKHKYFLDRLTCGELFDGMIERRIPLMLPLSESSRGSAGWALVGDVLREFRNSA